MKDTSFSVVCVCITGGVLCVPAVVSRGGACVPSQSGVVAVYIYAYGPPCIFSC